MPFDGNPDGCIVMGEINLILLGSDSDLPTGKVSDVRLLPPIKFMIADDELLKEITTSQDETFRFSEIRRPRK